MASSASMTNIERIFEKFDLNKYFKSKISGADLKESKPNPEIFVKAAKLSGHIKTNVLLLKIQQTELLPLNLLAYIV